MWALFPSVKICHVTDNGESTIKSKRQASGACIEVDDVEAGGGSGLEIGVTLAESPDDLMHVN